MSSLLHDCESVCIYNLNIFLRSGVRIAVSSVQDGIINLLSHGCERINIFTSSRLRERVYLQSYIFLDQGFVYLAR
jgi:hypothetical protein